MLLLVSEACSYYVFLYVTLPLQSRAVKGCCVSKEYADMKDGAKLAHYRENNCRCLSPGGNLPPWGSSSPVSSEEQKPKTASSPAPGERETAAERGGQEP